MPGKNTRGGSQRGRDKLGTIKGRKPLGQRGKLAAIRSRANKVKK
jgi:hypothetical protein